MRRFSLRFQLLLAFVFTFLLISFLSRSILFPMVNKPFEEEVYKQLRYASENYDISIPVENIHIIHKNIGYIFIDSNLDIHRSENVLDIITSDREEEIIKGVLTTINNGKTYHEFKIQDEDKSYLIFVVAKKQNDQGVLITLMDRNSVNFLKNNSPSKFTLISISIFLVSLIILFLWSNKLVKDINKLKKAIDNFEKDKDIDIKIKGRDELSQLAKSFNNLKNRLELQEQQKQDMFQNISHDLKTPLTTIQSYAEAIEDGIYPNNDLKQTAKVIVEQSDRLVKKVNQIMYLNKINYITNQKIELEEVKLVEVINNIVPLYKTKARHLIISTNSDNSIFNGNKESWTVIIENFLENSIRYANKNITITIENGVLEILNDGEPIESDILESMFKPYKKGRKGQFGLGMSIVYQTLNTFGYKIEVKNLNTGVLFRINKGKTII